MPGSRKRAVVSPEPHWLSLVQQVPAGTPGAIVDTVFGRSWIASPRSGAGQGLNGRGGWVQADLQPTLGDTSEMVVTVPPVGTDGRDHRKRFYFYADTPDPQNPGQTVGYVPGDEWVEVYRGSGKLLASGTPVSEQSTPSQLQITCRDVLQPLRKTQETGAGFWCHSPRDVFEFYTRADQTPVEDDFIDQAQWPATATSTPTTTPNGKWTHVGGQQSPLSGSYVRVLNAATTDHVHYHGSVTSNQAVTLGPSPIHGRWRVEAKIAAVSGGALVTLQLAPTSGTAGTAALTVAPSSGDVYAYTIPVGTGGIKWNFNAAGLLGPSGTLPAPLTLAIEGRERWVHFYINGQLVASGVQSAIGSPTALYPQVVLNAGSTTTSVDVDYVIARNATVPLNGSDPGDYRLASPPAAGGLWGEYYDLTQYPQLQPAPPSDTPVAMRVDAGISFINPPAWMPDGISAAMTRYIRWSGAIYLPLADQDIHFAIPTVDAANKLVLRVGRTRDAESVCNSGASLGLGEPPVSTTSVGMRSLLGSTNGWYPIILEYWWTLAATTNDTVEFTYDVGGAGSVPSANVLSPEGVMRGQITGSHYDALRTLSEQFVIEWVPEPRSLKSGAFPGVIVPKVRVQADTDKLITEAEIADPQSSTTAEDMATTTTGQAQGLGGSSSGTLTAEAFNFPVLGSHPFTSTEVENLPGTTDPNMLAVQLVSALALRSEPWQDVQINASGSHENHWIPLTGTLAEFDWQPGMGATVYLPSVGVNELRRILQAKRTVYPDGIGGVQVSFKQRPRNFQQSLRRFIRQVLTDRRTFQGQLTFVPGVIAQPPDYTQVPLPGDLHLVRQAWFVTLQKSDSSAWTVEVNGSAVPLTVIGPGRVDVSNYVAQNQSVEPRMIARVTGGTGSIAYQLVILEYIPFA